ncbi:MAG: hypothetical protein GX567_19155 [Clostridia bacterium]|nr:hypothetical protein [Clostridia bacterium]
MENKKKRYQLNSIRVCIDSYENGLAGRIYSPLCTEEITFEGIQELLLKADEIFDQVGYPQAFHEKRTFWGMIKKKTPYAGIPKAVVDGDEILEKKGLLITYDVIIKSRRNAGWQGTIYNEGGKRVHDFQGELELLKYLSN